MSDPSEHAFSERMEEVIQETECPYLPGQTFRSRYRFLDEEHAGEAEAYRHAMDLGWRRSGPLVYQPQCETCTACEVIRINVDEFTPRKDQKRCRKRNTDLSVQICESLPSKEGFALYQRYQLAIHDDDEGIEGYIALYHRPAIPGLELQARDSDGRLVAMSILDAWPDALSSVYCFYEPSEKRRALGTFMVLSEVEAAQQLGARWVYLGYHIAGCQKMAYKGRFGPAQIRRRDEDWRDFTPVKST